MRNFEELVGFAKVHELMNKKDEEGKKVLWILAIIGAIAVVAIIAFLVYKYLPAKKENDFGEDFADDFDDDFFDDDVEEVEEVEVAETEE